MAENMLQAVPDYGLVIYQESTNGVIHGVGLAMGIWAITVNPGGLPAHQVSKGSS